MPGNSLPRRFRAGSQHWEMKGEDESVTRTVTANRRKKKKPLCETSLWNLSIITCFTSSYYWLLERDIKNHSRSRHGFFLY